MYLSKSEWDKLLRENYFFSGRGYNNPDIVFWRENLRLFGTLNILLILGLQLMASFDYETFAIALEDPIFLNRVELSLFHRRETDQAALSALPRVGDNIEQQRVEITIRLMLYDRWRSILRDDNTRRGYISSMNTASGNCASIWDVGMIDEIAASSQIRTGEEGDSNAGLRMPEDNSRAGTSSSYVGGNSFTTDFGKISSPSDSVAHDAIPCCAICRENHPDEQASRIQEADEQNEEEEQIEDEDLITFD